MGRRAKTNKVKKPKSSDSEEESWPDMPQFMKLRNKYRTLSEKIRASCCILKTWRVVPKRCYATVNKSAYLQPQLECITTLYYGAYLQPQLECITNLYYGRLPHSNPLRATRDVFYDKTKDTFVKRQEIGGRSDISPCIIHERGLFDPYSSDNKLMELINFLYIDGSRCYALSLQGTLAVIEIVDSQQRITALGRNRAVPSVHSRYFREFLIESDGDILLVFLISKKSVNVIEEVEIFQLEQQTLSWIKMRSLGNRTMFVGPNYVSITASKVRCWDKDNYFYFRSNCIYFTHSDNGDWWIYDMNSNNTVTDWNDADDSSPYRIGEFMT